MSSFAPATRQQTYLKMCLAGPSGSGKSFTSLVFAHALKRAGLVKKIAVIESEKGKMRKYARYEVDGSVWEFDICVLTSYSPQEYEAKIAEAVRLGYDLIIIDSLSHEWQGKDGALETVDKLTSKSKFTEGWAKVTPMHTRFVESILHSPAHVIATARSKMEYALVPETKNGNTVMTPKKIGLAPIQRGDIEYEFEIYCELSTDHILTVSKTICPAIDGRMVACPKGDFMTPVIEWLGTGEKVDTTTFQYGFIDADRVNAILAKLSEANANLDQEREWLFKQFLVRDFTQLTPEQVAKYESMRLEGIVRRAREAREAAATPTPATPPAATPAPAPVVAPPADQATPTNGTHVNGSMNGTSTEASDKPKQKRMPRDTNGKVLVYLERVGPCSEADVCAALSKYVMTEQTQAAIASLIDAGKLRRDGQSGFLHVITDAASQQQPVTPPETQELAPAPAAASSPPAPSPSPTATVQPTSTAATTPAYVRPACLPGNKLDGVKHCWQEFQVANGWGYEDSERAWKGVLARFNAPDTKSLTDAQLDELERLLVGKVTAIYDKKGTPDANPFRPKTNAAD